MPQWGTSNEYHNICFQGEMRKYIWFLVKKSALSGVMLPELEISSHRTADSTFCIQISTVSILKLEQKNNDRIITKIIKIVSLCKISDFAKGDNLITPLCKLVTSHKGFLLLFFLEMNTLLFPFYTPVWKTGRIMWWRGMPSVRKLFRFRLTPPTVYIQSSWNLVYS